MTSRPLSARGYQLVCLLAAVGILLAAVRPAHSRLAAGRGRLIPPAERVGDTGELDSFAMGLMLGGFRGPLVMYLWVTAEEEKNRDETEKFMTRSELIGDLQPQFTSIYIHQSWNLAYNVSVQYNRPSEKYRWIMEGIAFAEKGERRIPNNVDILSQLGHLYFDKLGDSVERDYFKPRFRADSREQMLDADGRLKPQYAQRWKYIDRLDGLLDEIQLSQQRTGRMTVPDRPPPASSTRHRWPYGVSVFAIAYDYMKQATLLGPHQHFGSQVISSRPALACKLWAYEELDLAAAAEARVWPIDKVGAELPTPTADVVAGGRAALDEAVFHYREALAAAQLARATLLTHLLRFPYENDVFVPHLNDVAIRIAMAENGVRRLTGTIELLSAGGDPDKARLARQKLAEARTSYTNAIQMIRDYIATEYRVDPWADGYDSRRAPYELMAGQAERAAAQIDRLLK